MSHRKPYVVKAAEGNRGKRKLKQPAHVPGGAFDPPFELTADERKEWDRIRNEACWIKATDAGTLALCCQLIVECRALKADVAVEGWSITGSRGMVRNPKSTCLKDARAALMRCYADLGLTAMSREKITAQPENAENPEDTALLA